jgi:CRP-like cAMP-binding protein
MAAIDIFVRKLSRHDDLPPDEIAALRDLPGELREVRAGQDVVRAHQRMDHSSLLLSGLCGRYSALRDGRRQYTEINVPGDFVDLHSFVIKQLDHGIVTFSTSRFFEVPHAALARLTADHPHLTRLLWLETVIDAAIHRQWLLAMGRQSGPARLARLICELYLRLESAELARGLRMDLPMTQHELGETLGFTAVHTNRTLQALRERQLLDWEDQQIEIHDWNALADLAEFDPRYLRLTREPV